MVAAIDNIIYEEFKISCEDKEFNFYCNSDDVIFVSCVILFTGVSLSLISLVAPISTWILFRSTRNMNNYISLNQCITSTLLTAVICALYYEFYTGLHTFRELIDMNETPDWKLIQDAPDVVTAAKCLNIAMSYVLVSMYCWNTAAAVLCYLRVVKVFSRNIRRKYLTVNLLCYAGHIPLVVIHSCLIMPLFPIKRTRLTSSIIIISVPVILTVVLLSLYLCVAVAICKGKRPGHGETVRTVTTALVISSMFGLWFCVSFTVWAHFPLLNDISSLHTFYYGMSSQIFQNLFLAIHPTFISLMHVMRVENRKMWVKLFSRNIDSIPGI